jgi:sugar phosphate isomerase/epimerase
MLPPSAPAAAPKLLHVWSLGRELLSRKLDIMEVPALAAESGFQGVEWLDRLMPSFDPDFWQELNQVQARAGFKASAFSLSLELTADSQSIAAQKDQAKTIIGLCPKLGVDALRVSVGGGGRFSMARLMAQTQAAGGKRAGEPRPLNALSRGLYKLMLRLPQPAKNAGGRADAMTLQSAAWSLQPLARQAASLGMRLGVENHFGLTSHPQDLLTLLDLTMGDAAKKDLRQNQDAGWAERSPLTGGGLGVCLDTGNHPLGVDPTEAARLLAPRAVHVHWKLKNNPPSDDERQSLAIHAEHLRAAGYDGLVSVEYEGKGAGLAGAKAALDLLRGLY